MEIKKIEYQKARKEADVYTDSSADYSLPDYNGDIKRVLYAGAKVSPAAQFSDGDTVSCAGVVSYDIIYQNGEGKLDKISFTSDYEARTKIKSDNVIGYNIDTSVASFNYRLLGPRRISAKATLVSDIRYTEGAVMETVTADDSSEMECISSSVQVMGAAYATSEEREYAETIARFDGAVMDDVSVIHLSVTPSVENVKCEDGGASVKGYFTVCALIKSDDTAPMLYKKKIPLDEFITSDGINANMSAYVIPQITSETSHVNADENGSSVTVSLISDLSLRAVYNEPVEIIKDAYLKTAESENEYENFGYTTSMVCETHPFEVTESLPIGDISDSGIREVLFIAGVAKVNETAVAGSVLTVIGELRCTAICMNVGEDAEESFFGVKFTVPINENITLSSQITEGAEIDARLRVNDITASVDSENFYVDASLSCDVCISVSASVTRLTSCRGIEGREYEPRSSRVTVYYPAKNDTLFEVAKKYHTSASQIAKDNALTESVMNSFDKPDSLAGIKKLIIK